jgi:hypothetical protein
MRDGASVTTIEWIAAGLAAWFVLSLAAGLILGRLFPRLRH